MAEMYQVAAKHAKPPSPRALPLATHEGGACTSVHPSTAHFAFADSDVGLVFFSMAVQGLTSILDPSGVQALFCRPNGVRIFFEQDRALAEYICERTWNFKLPLISDLMQSQRHSPLAPSFDRDCDVPVVHSMLSNHRKLFPEILEVYPIRDYRLEILLALPDCSPEQPSTTTFWKSWCVSCSQTACCIK